MTRFRGEYIAERKALHNAVRAEAGDRCVRCFHPGGDTPSVRVPCDDRCTHPRDGKMRILTELLRRHRHHARGSERGSGTLAAARTALARAHGASPRCRQTVRQRGGLMPNPEIGAVVRITESSLGYRGWMGSVVAHHEDGETVAVQVRDQSWREPLLLSPSDYEVTA
jgi:hypothetical protein